MGAGGLYDTNGEAEPERKGHEMSGADHMEDREVDRRAVARGLRRAFAVEADLPGRFRDLLDQIGGDAPEDGGACDIRAPRGTSATRKGR